ncbi:GntR family transcriptional regulator [Photobacterium aphoticum]|uniref:Transcriptional regulator n=1 Tax=Photobacterium aphoticum TaxID=754436 RepID=A0A0J1JB69_9GAMM|nr:GntR family transcriptional regulator [Photobacterium aphoticum]KLU98841.1 transcriptional regulator [Photobacterium aphoticum]PSU56745.1 UTRA domain-containing protein [Photobacterium aphoticum]GHA65829.1 XRE family transcriptional regulator [Photobacterium aphoticum]
MARLPMYRQIAEAIKAKIQSGEYLPGEALPTEAQLREAHSVSRVTVRQALKLLIEQNVLESIQGSGTYVKDNKVNYDMYQYSSFEEKLSHLNVKTHSEILAFEITVPSQAIAEALEIAPNERIFYVKRVRFIDDNPVTLEETWLPLSLFPDLSYEVMQGSKYEYIEGTKKMVIDRSEQEIIPVLPPEEVVKQLGIPAEQPIIEKITKGYLADGTVFEYSRNYFKSSDYKFTLVAKRNRHY